MKIRCPICNGTDGVELSFGTGYMMSPTDGYTSNVCAKQCPGCGGTGMQESEQHTYELCNFWKIRACKSMTTNNCWNRSCPDHDDYKVDGEKS